MDDFGQIWEARWETNKKQYAESIELAKRRCESQCSLCPPFSDYVNRAVERHVRSQVLSP